MAGHLTTVGEALSSTLAQKERKKEKSSANKI